MSQHKNKKILRHGRKRQALPLMLLLGGGLLLVVGAAYAFFKPSQPKADIEVIGAPRLNVNNELVNLGDVKLDRTVEASFLVTNTGDQTLRFTDAPYIEVLEGC